MDILQAMEQRHSVRQYTPEPLGEEAIATLRQEIERCNKASGLHIQLVLNEPKAFDGFLAHYGKFSGVQNYIALVGTKNSDLDETCGYYGQQLVLRAQQLGLNTCWVGLTYRKTPDACKVGNHEKLAAVIALGHGVSNGSPHRSKSRDAVSNAGAGMPQWFQNGVDAALLAPTAMNQQKFYFSYENGTVRAKAGLGFYSKMDLGIVKYHFELGAGKENVVWQ